MAYSTTNMVRQALFPTVDGSSPAPATSHTAADLSDQQLVDAIAEADSTIDGYLAGIYDTPVAPANPNGDPLLPPTPILYWSRNIAAYLATLTKRQNQNVDATNPVYLRYVQTMQALVAVAAGTFKLGIAQLDGSGPGNIVSGGAINQYGPTLFGSPGADGFDIGGSSWPNTRPFEGTGRWF